MLGLPKACLMPKQNDVLRSVIADLSLDFEGPVPKGHNKLRETFKQEVNALSADPEFY